MNGLRVLITGGRAPCALDLARAFAGRGAEVYTAESLEHPLCAASRAVKRNFRVPPPAQDPAGYAAALRDIVRSEGIGLLLPTCEEIFYISAYRDSFGPDCRVLAPPLGTLRELHSKWAFISLCARLGFAVPETVRLEFADRDGRPDLRSREKAAEQAGSGESAADGAVRAGLRREERIAGEIPRPRPGDPAYILKPEFSRFSARQSRHAALDEARAEARREGGVWVAQRYAGGEMLCTYGAAHGGRLLAHAAYRAPQTASGASVCFKPDADPDVREWVSRFVERTGFSGQLAFDFIRTDEGVLLPIECNPRATSGVHLLLAPQSVDGGEAVNDGYKDQEAYNDQEILSKYSVLRPSSASTASAIKSVRPLRNPDLLDALAQPERVRETIIARPVHTPMLMLPMLGSGWSQLGHPKRFAGWLHDFRGSRDVLLRRGDIRVLPQALKMMLELRSRAGRLKGSMSEASVSDIAWDGQPIGAERSDGRGEEITF